MAFSQQPGASSIQADSLTGAHIAAGAIGSSELADDAVDTAAIQNLAVTAGKIANDTITAAQLAVGAVGSSELADDAVDTAAIQNLAVTTGKLADESVTGVKVADEVVGQWRTVWAGSSYIGGGGAAADYWMRNGGTAYDANGPINASHFDFDPADYAIAGRTLETRLVTRVLTNATDPLTSGVLDVTVKRITAAAGAAGALTLTGSATALATQYTAAEITASLAPLRKTDTDTAGLTAGLHGIVMAPTATLAANSILHVSAMFQVRHT